ALHADGSASAPGRAASAWDSASGYGWEDCAAAHASLLAASADADAATPPATAALAVFPRVPIIARSPATSRGSSTRCGPPRGTPPRRPPRPPASPAGPAPLGARPAAPPPR